MDERYGHTNTHDVHFVEYPPSRPVLSTPPHSVGLFGGQVWERRAEYQIVESVKYFFNEMERIKQDDFVATQQDVLYSRVRTSGIVTER